MTTLANVWLDWGLPVWIRFPVGFVLLIAGAEYLVRGASRLAAGAGISPLVIGLTVVAFGTSAPELAVSVGASLTGDADVAVGNVIGSNIMNILLILGLSAVVAPLAVQAQLVRLEVPLMIGVSLLTFAFAWNGMIGRGEGLVLVLLLGAYLVFVFRLSRRGKLKAAAVGEAEVDAPSSTKGVVASVAFVLGGMLALMLGARWLVDGAKQAALYVGVSELVIGLTVVAVGTSLPELATSVAASLRGERDIAVGNVVGSNLFNLLCVLGLTAVLPPAGVRIAPEALAFDFPVMIATALACFPIFFTGGRISRLEGALLLGYFFAYVGFLVLNAQEHAAVVPFRFVMTWFVLPLTAFGLLLGLGVSVRNRFRRPV